MTMGAAQAMAATLAKPTGKVILTISGLIGNTNNGEKAEFDMPMIEALGTVSFTTKTPWYKDPVTFTGVPSFYFVASSKPLAEIVSPATAALYRLGIDSLQMKARNTAPPDVVDEFAKALARTQQGAKLFPNSVGKVNFIGERLFRTTIEFPSNVPTGTYLVEVFLVRDRDVVSGQTTPLVVSKVGLDADVSGFAGRQPGLYGAIAVFTAMMAGWLASLPFRSA